MFQLLLRIFLVAVLGTLPGCALWPGKNKKSQSGAHLYEGEAPTMHYSDKPENAGGRLNPY
jgi:hypothetical protein